MDRSGRTPMCSPATARHDRGPKKAAFERAGVPEYWIDDPKRRVVERHVLVEGRYEQKGSASETLSPLRFPDVVVDLTTVW